MWTYDFTINGFILVKSESTLWLEEFVENEKFINLFLFILGTKGLKAICPFCSIVLSETKPFVRLIFQDSIYRY